LVAFGGHSEVSGYPNLKGTGT